MIDNNNVRISKDIPIRQVDTLPHVQHLLSIADPHFQVHKSFIFILSNTTQRRQSSFKARLATNRSWFPVVQELMQKIDTHSMDTYQLKLEKNYVAKPETIGAEKVMKYLNYVSDHIPGGVNEKRKRNLGKPRHHHSAGEAISQGCHTTRFHIRGPGTRPRAVCARHTFLLLLAQFRRG